MNGWACWLSGGLRAVELVTGTRRPDADALMEAALRGSDAGPSAFDEVRDPLRRFLRACEEEAGLSALGRWATGWDVHRFLVNLLRLASEEARAPDILDQPVTAPIFITGVPRSGTTFLHSLMAEDPTVLAPRCWQTIYPYPRGPLPGGARHAGQGDDRARRVEAQLRWFAMLSPDIRSVHPIDAQSPQECTEITAHVFQSLRFDTNYEMPSYRQWLDQHGHLAAYRFHKRFLQHLQGQAGPGQWVLKSPDHLFALDALQQVYPDARFVFVHRDPLKIIPSVARLTEILRMPFARDTDPRRIGREVMDNWVRGCAVMVDISRRCAIPSARVLHVHYADMVARPLDTVKAIYSHFGLPLHGRAIERMNRLIGQKPHGGYGRNRYRLEAYAISPQEIRERFRDYVRHFDIALESGAKAEAAV